MPGGVGGTVSDGRSYPYIHFVVLYETGTPHHLQVWTSASQFQLLD
jgi:hypothetical protein